MVWE